MTVNKQQVSYSRHYCLVPAPFHQFTYFVWNRKSPNLVETYVLIGNVTDDRHLLIILSVWLCVGLYSAMVDWE